MENKELLLEAINNYDLFTPKDQIILKLFIELAIDNNTIVTSVKSLNQLTGISKTTIYKVLDKFEQAKLIESVKGVTPTKSCFVLNSNKLEDIIKHYTSQKNVKYKFKKYYK